jgi:hypothetical protein
VQDPAPDDLRLNVDSPQFGHSDALLATVDLAHDGHLVLIGYELWANDYGIDVFADGVNI